MATKNRSTSPFWQLVHYILGFPKSVYLNWRCLPARQAIRMPLLCSHKTRLKHLCGHISVPGKLKMGLVKIGLGTSQLSDFLKERTIIDWRGTIVFDGRCKIGSGSRIAVSETGTLIFHDNFHNSSRLYIICNKHIEMGKNVGISWDTTLMDSDQHRIFNADGVRINEDAPIVFEDNVWCGCHAIILKNTHITHDVIIGAGAIVGGQHLTPNVVLAGQPATILKQDIHWN